MAILRRKTFWEENRITMDINYIWKAWKNLSVEMPRHEVVHSNEMTDKLAKTDTETIFIGLESIWFISRDIKIIRR